MTGTLGAGGAGVVYRAYDHQLRRTVALKVLRHAVGRDLYRFKREFRSLADIVHPNLVALHELYASSDEWFFAMEMVEGVSFIDWVRPSKEPLHGPRTRQDIISAPLDEDRLRKALPQLIDALVALHRVGKLHRDLKPSNVLVTPEGRVVLLDFGLVAGVAEDNHDGLAVGTPVYMSPEQAADQPLDTASDWYALGAMLYEALTGRRPFEGASEQVMRRKQTERPTPPEALMAGVAQDLALMAKSLLEPVPALRPDGLALLAQLGSAPSAATREIGRHRSRATFVGRARELDALRGAFRDSRRRGVSLFLHGPSGIGKSTLIDHFVKDLGEDAFILSGRCFERESVPFKMLDGVVDALTNALLAIDAEQLAAIISVDAPSLVRLFPVLRRVPPLAEVSGASTPANPQELRTRGFAALRHMLAKLSRVRQVVIVVDDVHWGDGDSSVFISELVSRPEPGILLLICHRPEDYLGIVAAIRRAAAPGVELRDVPLLPLDEQESRALVRELAPDDWFADNLLPAAGGNPLLLTELLRSADSAPSSVEALVAARAARVSADAQALLIVVSVAGRPISIEIATHAAAVLGGLDEANELYAERLISLRRVDGQLVLEPSHDYVRASVVLSLSPVAKAGWHEALALSYEAYEAADSQAVVEHWLAAGHPARAAQHAVSAAVAAETAMAFLRAVEMYQVAIEYGQWSGLELRDLVARRAHALMNAGQLDEAIDGYGRAARVVLDEQSIDLERRRVEQLLRRGRLVEALPAAEAVLAGVGLKMSLTRVQRSRLLPQWGGGNKARRLDFVQRDASMIPVLDLRRIDVLYSISSGLAFTDPSLGRAVQQELMRHALAAGEPVRVILALILEAGYQATTGTRAWPAVEQLAERIKQVATAIAEPHLLGIADCGLGVAAFLAGRWSQARMFLEAGIGTLRSYGNDVRWELDIAELYLLSSLLYLGQWREMARLQTLFVRDAGGRGDRASMGWLRSGRIANALVFQDKAAQAREELEVAESDTPRDAFVLAQVHNLIARCSLELQQGHADTAANLLDSSKAVLARAGATQVEVLRAELDILRARAELARPDRDERAARGFCDRLIKDTSPMAVAAGHALRGVLHASHDGASAAELELAERMFAEQAMEGWVHLCRLRRAQLQSGPLGLARVEAARDALRDLGAFSPDAIADWMLPMPRARR
ncbi:MAG: serine/threonine-protein kinase PknK [Myxococcales bacterium]|nr:serine/threonine-protein kinase PknK [Myxococcales bacterium]